MKKGRQPEWFGFWMPSAGGWGYGGVQVSNLSDEHKQLVELGDIFVPRSFTARFDRDGLPLLELDIGLVEGRLRCVELRVLRRRETDFVEGKDLRAIPTASLIREAVTFVAYLPFELQDDAAVARARSIFQRFADLEANPVALDKIEVGDVMRVPVLYPLMEGDTELFEAFRVVAETRLAGGNPQTRKTSITHEQVAEVYRDAYVAGNVIDAVAGRFGWRRQTAKNRIRAARKAGFLPPTVPGSRRA